MTWWIGGSVAVLALLVFSWWMGGPTGVTVDLAQKVVELEQRVHALDREYELCCTSQRKDWNVDGDLESRVRLRRQMKELEERVTELEAR